jgi:hypothetical protein
MEIDLAVINCVAVVSVDGGRDGSASRDTRRHVGVHRWRVRLQTIFSLCCRPITVVVRFLFHALLYYASVLTLDEPMIHFSDW